ncbi:hypothetical protein [Neobacillus sp. FSL H8-0543]|uniref:hypothetical protein n=1 Tax=Neobacillus sp. FSL H8-0543 TaxID=2954672 RepID=UPI003158C578
MKEYIFTKTLGIIAGTLIILLTIGFGILSFIGMSLAKALNASADDSTTYVLPIVMILLLLGVITAVVPFWLKRKAAQVFYTGFSFVMGIALIVAFFLSVSAIGTEEEIFILCVGIFYLLLGFLAKKRL